MENYTSGTAIENSPDSQKSPPLAFHGFSKVVNVFLSLRFSYPGGQWSLKQLIVFCFSVPVHSFC